MLQQNLVVMRSAKRRRGESISKVAARNANDGVLEQQGSSGCLNRLAGFQYSAGSGEPDETRAHFARYNRRGRSTKIRPT